MDLSAEQASGKIRDLRKLLDNLTTVHTQELSTRMAFCAAERSYLLPRIAVLDVEELQSNEMEKHLMAEMFERFSTQPRWQLEALCDARPEIIKLHLRRDKATGVRSILVALEKSLDGIQKVLSRELTRRGVEAGL